jgi:peptidyl-prolyl cis-trans isomerase B (cyclophilin B)
VKNSPFLDRDYTIFGEVVKGIEIADKIVGQPRDSNNNPLDRIEMTIEVME